MIELEWSYETVRMGECDYVSDEYRSDKGYNRIDRVI